jgi:Subtilase family
MKIYNNKLYVFYLRGLFRYKSDDYNEYNINKKKIKSFTVVILIILSLSFTIFPSTLSKSMAQTPEESSQRSVPSVNTADQLSLLRYCLTSESACSPSITYVDDSQIFQRPFAVLEPKEVILQLRQDLVPSVDLHAFANEIAQRYNVIVLDLIDTPVYKAIVIRAPETNNQVLLDTRFVKYNLANNAGGGEFDEFKGHTTQLKWNQTIPYGIKRTTPVTSAAAGQTVGNNNVSATSGGSPHKERTVDVDIAVLDTGISLSHPDLNVYRNVSFVPGTTSGNDDNGHGSHVAGIAAAKDNSIGVVGEAPGARLWAIKVCDGSGECKISTQIKGIEYAIKHANEIDVLNISIENPNSPALNNIISEAVKAGITVVVSAGNYGRDASTTTPANNPNVLTVSAIGDTDGKCGGSGPAVKLAKGTVADDSLAYFSNFGRVVKIAAPGVDIFSTYKGSGYAVDSGTSMAAPYVAGAAALYKSQFPNASPAQTMAGILALGSLPTTVCDGGAHGYFSGDRDGINEPLLFRKITSNVISPEG